MRYNNTTTIANNFEAVKTHVESLTDSDQVNFYNIYCQNCNNSDSQIFNNDEEFFNMFFEGKVLEAVRAVSFGSYNYSDDYVMFNGYANLESFDSPSDKISITEIVSDILETPESYEIELEDCFLLDGIMYEGTEEEAKEQFTEYWQETFDNNKEAVKNEEDTEIILSFKEWAAENLTESNI